jgi:hypothetical protein
VAFWTAVIAVCQRFRILDLPEALNMEAVCYSEMLAYCIHHQGFRKGGHYDRPKGLRSANSGDLYIFILYGL